MTLAAGGGGSGGCCGCYLVGGVVERQVGSFTRHTFVKAFCAWELFVSAPCKLLDASAQTEANSSAQGSVQVLPWGMFPLQTDLSSRLSPACPLWQGAGVQIARAVLTGLAPVAGEAGGA